MSAFFSDALAGLQAMDLGDDDSGGSGGSGGSSQPSQTSTQNSADTPEELRQFFTSSPRFRFVRMLPQGSTAHPMLFSEHEVEDHGNGHGKGKEVGNNNGEDKSDDAGRMKRRIVVKSARDSTFDGDLAAEQRWLDRLAGSAHIVRSLDLGLDYSTLRRRIVMMEYVAHGDIGDLVARLRQDSSDVVVPSRLLWRFFLCLLRAVTAMAFPPLSIDPNAASDDTPFQLEQIPEGTNTPSLMVHGDMHHGNVLIGNLFRPDSDLEHDLTPLLKVTDFGEAKTIPEDPDAGPWTAVTVNMGEAATIIMLLAEKMNYDNHAAGAMYQYPDDDNGTPGDEVPTQANEEWETAQVMPKLRDVIYMCLDDELVERPELDKVIKMCEDAERDFDKKQLANESDGAIRQFVKRFIFDADDGSTGGTNRRRERTSNNRSFRLRRWQEIERQRHPGCLVDM